MKKKSRIALGIILLSSACLCVFRKAGLKKSNKPQKKLEDEFVDRFTEILTENAKVYTGMYTSVWKAVTGKKGKADKIVKEWNTRTRYQWENDPIIGCSDELLKKLSETSGEDGNWEYLALVFEAIKRAGISADAEQNFVLDEANVQAYHEWEERELYIGDQVQVISPAWYQKCEMIEMGYCSKKTD